ncbi:MAG: flagellar biosynthetic protein FliR [Firmicutes bacterium]|nr:flagellar biosynthetic protein FliR [Bacillota bacterium]
MVIPSYILVFLLVLLRTLGVAGTAPWLGNTQVPTIWKIGIGLLLALIVTTTIPAHQLLPTASTLQFPAFIVLAVQETLVGVALGFIMNVVFAAVEVAGGLLDLQIGLSIASIVSPGLVGPVTLLSNFEYMLFTLWFLAVNGHYVIILAILQSFRVLPIGAAHFSGPLENLFIQATANLFVLAIQMAAPVMLSLFITNVSLAAAARAVPQMNVFAVGLPLSLFVGFLVLSSVMPDLGTAFQGLLTLLETQIDDALRAMGGVFT